MFSIHCIYLIITKLLFYFLHDYGFFDFLNNLSHMLNKFSCVQDAKEHYHNIFKVMCQRNDDIPKEPCRFAFYEVEDRKSGRKEKIYLSKSFRSNVT